MKKHVFLFVFALLCSIAAYSQEKCAAQLLLNQDRIEHPEILAIEAYLNGLDSLSPQTIHGRSTYQIPIVVHVVHDYGAEYISDAQIFSAIQQLNLDFNAANPDTSDVINYFKPLIGNASIQFIPARFDPDGNCTNGIDRIPDESTYNGYSKPNPWPQYRYLNFWVVNNITGGNAGYATFPFSSGALSNHGVVVQYNSFNNTSRTPTHECGHFFNLYHIWDASNACGATCNGTDHVGDTPETIGYTGCPSPSVAQACTSGVLENYQNYMDYTYCARMFTHGQVNRMHNCLASMEGARKSLTTDTTANFTGILLPMVTCPPKIDFTPGYFKNICAGDSVYFQQLTYGSAATDFNWSFPGGIPSTSTSPNVWVKYPSSGVYDVTLTASNAAGTHTATKTSFIQVLSSSSAVTGSFYEDFEDSTQFFSDWTIFSKKNNEWQNVGVTSYTGARCAGIHNFSSNNNETDWLISPIINLSTIASPQLSFAHSYAQVNTNNDQLSVYVSTDCGSSWNGPIYAKSGNNLATAADDTMNFIPVGQSEWIIDTVDLSLIASQQNIRFGFKMESDKGNNIYLDDINIYSLFAVVQEEDEKYRIKIYPNPASEYINIFVQSGKEKVDRITMLDYTGKVVFSCPHPVMSSADQVYQLPVHEYATGFYSVEITIGAYTNYQKIMIW